MTPVTAQPLTPAGFAPFGHVVEAGAGAVKTLRGGALRLTRSLAQLDAGAPGLALVFDHYDLAPQPFPVTLEQAERHARTAQLFSPLPGCGDWLVVVWPAAGSAVGTVAGAAARLGGPPLAFVARPDQAVIYKPGIWHHGIVALAGGANARRVCFLSAMWRGEDGADVDFHALPHGLRVVAP